jgi:hypothetical protein
VPEDEDPEDDEPADDEEGAPVPAAEFVQAVTASAISAAIAATVRREVDMDSILPDVRRGYGNTARHSTLLNNHTPAPKLP